MHDLIPGRVRLRVAEGWPDAEVLDELGRLEGVEKVRASQLTGSVLVHYRVGATDPNRIQRALSESPRSQRRRPAEIFRQHARSLPSLLLVTAGGLALATGGLADAAVIALCWLGNNALGCLTESLAERAVAFESVDGRYRTLRHGHWATFGAGQLEPGDRVELEPGQWVAADGRIVEDRGLRIDESTLTGESEPVARPERAWAGTTVCEGGGLLQVERTNAECRVQGLRNLIGSPRSLPDGVQRELTVLSRGLMLASAVLGAGILALGAVTGLGQAEALRTALALAISTLPEGLPTLVTLGLVRGASSLRREGVAVRRLGSLLSLARVNAVCIDKTGTLTRNQLEVARTIPLENAVSAEVLNYALLATDSQDAIARALLEAGAQLPGEVIERLPRRGERPFCAARSQTETVFLGAPEALLEPCPEIVASLAAQRLRVMAVAIGAPDAELARPLQLRAVGLIAFRDGLRPQARALVRELKSCDLQLMMLTGDHPETARAVAESLDAGALEVRSRMSPEEKRAAVRELQSRGLRVAMLGDGFNDAPALLAADTSATMISGSPAARALADVVLADDRIDAYAAAVREGRLTLLDLRRTTGYLLSCTFADIFLVASCALLGIPFPLSGRQLLWMNLVSDTLPGLLLLGERSQPETSGEALVDRRLAGRVGQNAAAIAGVTLASYLWGTHRYGAGARTSSLTFTAITLTEILYALACRPRGAGAPSPALLGGLASVGALQVAAVAHPGLAALLGTTALSWSDAGVVAAAAGSALAGTSWVNRRGSG